MAVKNARKKVSAAHFMQVMNKFTALTGFGTPKCAEALGISSPTWMKWGKIYFDVHGDLSKCYFIEEDSIDRYYHPEKYSKEELAKDFEVNRASVFKEPEKVKSIVSELPKLNLRRK